jgi:hypothetical protein
VFRGVGSLGFADFAQVKVGASHTAEVSTANGISTTTIATVVLVFSKGFSRLDLNLGNFRLGLHNLFFGFARRVTARLGFDRDR